MTHDAERGASGAAGAFGRVREVARAGVVTVLRHPLASATTVACLVVMLAPLLVGFGISRGVADQVAVSLAQGADLCVTATRFGRPAPFPATALDTIRAIPGVTSAEPRIVGTATLGDDAEPVVVVGVAAERMDPSLSAVTCAEGRLPRPGGVAEVCLGSDLAARVGLRAGATIPPFYRNRGGERLTTVSGTFRSDLPMWQAHVMLTTIETAERVFDERGSVTSVLVHCDPSYREAVRRRVLLLGSLAPAGASPLAPRVVTRDDLDATLVRRTGTREGALALALVGALAIGVPLLLVSTGLGLDERRRETGLLAALGWRTDEIVLRSFAESLVLAALGWSLAVLAAWIWVRGFGAAGVAGTFLPDAAGVPGFDVPFGLVPEAAVASAVVAVVLVSAGTALTAWRAASAPPVEAMR